MSTLEVVEQVIGLVEVSETEVILTTEEVVQTLEVGIAGPQGIQGPTGAQGPQGPQGPAGGESGSYTHTQATPSAVWTIVHNLGYRPSVHIEDTTGRDVEGEIAHTNANELVLTFSAAFAGSAFLS